MFRPQIGFGVGAFRGSGSGLSPDSFAMTVDTTKAGSASDTFILPLASTETYNFEVNWGDGNSDTITVWNQAETTHVYSSSGTYQITITGTFPTIVFNNGGDRLKLSSIDQWGIISWTTFVRSFKGCSNVLGLYTDSPDLSGVISLFDMFNSCSLFNGSFIGWDTSTIINMAGTLSFCSVFNQPINHLDTSSVTTMNSMLAFCTIFNQEIDGLDTSSVTNMTSLLHTCPAFNKPVNGLDVSSNTAFNSFFQGCTLFNQSFPSWDMSSGISFANFMQDCPAFNQVIPFTTSSSATSYSAMFRNCTLFNQDLSGLNYTQVTTMTLFLSGTAFDNSNYDTTLVGILGWSGGSPTKTVQSGVNAHFGAAQYSIGTDAEDARADLIASDTWTITDGGGV